MGVFIIQTEFISTVGGHFSPTVYICKECVFTTIKTTI